MSQTRWREPIEFCAGDTLAFIRKLADYPASAGWYLLYELRGGAQAIEFTSTADGDNHSVNVPAATTAAWLPGDYVLAGFAVNGDERQRVFSGSVTISPNLPQTAGDEVQKTFAQKMLEQLETAMLAAAGDNLAASQVAETRFQYLTPEQLRAEHGYWTQVRRQEIAKERAKQGLPTGNKIRPRMNIVGAAPVIGSGVWPYA